jgi:MFS transporter, DHA1 family, multidrug resistance protein
MDAPANESPILSRRELTALVIGLMAVTALCIDVMLPALPEIGAALKVPRPNDRQLVVGVFVMASGIAQLFYGPLADAFGRRRVLLVSLAIGGLGSLVCLLADSFELLLAGRAVQGVSAASTRVISTALVRDLFGGRRMAQIMSTAMMVLLVVPMFAPALGQWILLFGPWRWLFAMLLVAFSALTGWIALRLPETLPPERRIPLRPTSQLAAYREVFRSRATVGYTLALALVFATMFSFLTSAQQIYVEIYQLGAWFPLAFAATGATQSLSQFLNARLVMSLGMRRLSQRASIGFALVTVMHALYLAWQGSEPLPMFLFGLLTSTFLFGFIGPNFGAIAMEPVGHVAGSAAALNGFLSTVVGAVIGGAIGQAFDGTTRPFVYGQAVLAVSALALVLITERGQLARHEAS